jgi:putative spermidine/putrescine transport system substrate-binding protein
MTQPALSRRALAATAAAAALAALARKASAQLAMPSSPVALNIVDAAGSLALLQTAIENYRRANPGRVSRIAFTKATQPEIASKIKAQQNANRVDIDLILAGYDGLTGGFEQRLWLDLLPAYANALPNLDEILLDGARQIQQQTQGQGICVAYSPYGPLLEYAPDRVNQAPRTAEDLLAWCRQNKGRFMYARMANSGPARALIVGLPYILGDANPKDPVKGWDKTWSYLEALGETVEYYPSGTAAVLKEFGDGSRDLIPSTTGWDINPRALGIVPAEAKITTLQGFHWVSDAHCICVPKGVSQEKLPVLLDLISFVLTPAQQAYAYDSGYFYPGPAVKGVTLDMAPEESQRIIREYGRPEYERLIADVPKELPLDPIQTAAAFRRWDEQIGSQRAR